MNHSHVNLLWEVSLGRVAAYLIASTAVVISGWLAASAPGMGTLLIGILIVGAAAVAYPGWVLASGLFLSVTSPAVVELAAFGPRVLVLAGLIGLARLAFVRFKGLSKDTVALLALLMLLIVSIGLGSNMDAAGSFVVCAAAVLAAVQVQVLRKPWVLPFASASAGFVIVSQVAGDFTATGDRFAGVSGNPNRMVFGILVALCFLLHAFFVSRNPGVRLSLALAIVVAIRMVLASGSDQGVAGLFVLGSAVSVFAFRRLERSTATFLAGVFCICVVLVLIGANVTQYLSEDTLTLSGRTGIFASGVDTFLENPIFGTGEARVDHGYVEDRSTHNSIISVAVASGIVGLGLWLMILWRSTRASLWSLRNGNLAAAAVVVVVVAQLVQQVELVPLTWGVLAFLGNDQDREGLA